MRVGILGGTFDPIHIGHLIIATELRHALDLDQVRFAPAADPPHKSDQRITPAKDRVGMLELAIADSAEFAIDRVDLDRTGPSYTKETLATLKLQEPMADFVFLMGADSLRDLPNWNDPGRILELAEIGVAARPEVELDLDDVIARLPRVRDRVTVVPVPLIGISSSDIRRRCAEGAPIAFQVPRPVERYIRERRLYRVP